MDFRDPTKLQLPVFIKNAWSFHVRIINWPVGVPFIKHGVQTAKGFLPRYDLIHSFSARELDSICSNRVKALMAEAEGKVVKNAGPAVEMVYWDEGKFLWFVRSDH